MALVSLAQNSQDHKTMENVVLIFALEMNSFMNGDTASHAHQARFMTEVVEAVRMVETFLPTSSQSNAVIVNIDPLMVLNVSNAQITLVRKTEIPNVVEINVSSTKFKKLMEPALTAPMVLDQTSSKGTVSKLSATPVALQAKSMLKL